MKSRKGEIFLTYFDCLKGQRAKLFLGLTFSVFGQICSLFIPLLIKFILDKIILGNFFSYLKHAVILGIFVSLLLVLSSYGANYLMYLANGESGIKFKTNFFAKMQGLPINLINRFGSGIIVHRIIFDLDCIVGYWTQTIATVPLVLTLICGTGIMIYMNNRIAFCILIVLIIQFILILFFSRHILKASFEVKKQNEKVTSDTIKQFDMLELVRTFGNEYFESEKFKKNISKQFFFLKKYFLLGKGYNNVCSFLSYLYIFLVLLIGGRMVYNQIITIGTLMAFIMLMNVVNAPLFKISELVLSFQDVKAAFTRYKEFETIEHYLHKGIKKNLLMETFLPLDIIDLNFSYTENIQVLKKVNLHLNGNQIVTLIGKSVTGKTTFCKILARLMDCDSGDILYNNQKIEDIDLECLRRNVHLNLQNNVIFNDTLWNNLTYGVHNKNIMEEDLFRCMKAAGIDFFHKLQNGFQTILGYNGASISVGQAQRIAIARALLLEPRIVIFDEPASSIDPQTEMLLHETFKKLRERSLVIIITHRRSTLKISDRVLYFEKGTVRDITKQKELQDRFFNEIDEKKN